MLQQYLPLAVLKQYILIIHKNTDIVATVLTACGIETVPTTMAPWPEVLLLQQYLPLAVLKLC